MHDEIKRIQAKYGRDSVAIISTGQLLTEEFYTLGKLTRGLIGTNNYDGNTTLCMSSAVSGYKRSFGSDGPPGCYEDFEHTDCLIAWGSNLPEQHPIIYWRMKEAQEKRGFPLIVVDPRVTMLAQNAHLHLAITPGTDVVLMNAMMHVIFKEGLEDKRYIDANTTGIEALRAEVEKYDPVTAAKICGIDEDTIRVVARTFAKAAAAMQIWTMGINQSTHGSDGVVGINNLALITGNIGKPGGTSLSITGQCNAMGTREWSSCSGLPNYRYLENPEHREEVAKFWNVDPEFFPKQRGMFQTDIYQAMEAGQIKGLWLIATNPMSSLPNTSRIRKAMEQLEFCCVQDCYQDTESAQYAHVYLPAATWAEKEGVMTNTERRINLVKPVTQPPGDGQVRLVDFQPGGGTIQRRRQGEVPRSRCRHIPGNGRTVERPAGRHLRHEPRFAGDKPRRAVALHRRAGCTRRGPAQGGQAPVHRGRRIQPPGRPRQVDPAALHRQQRGAGRNVPVLAEYAAG